MHKSAIQVVDKNHIRLKGTLYTRDGCIADLQAVAASQDDPNRTVSQRFYRDRGTASDSVIEFFFGTFVEFRRQAGLVPTRQQNIVRNSAARFAAADNLQRIRQERLSYGSLYMKDRGERFRTALIFSDLHDKDVDPFLRRVLIDTAKRVQPAAIISGGDHFDMPEWSKYFQDPRDFDLAGRLEAGLSVFRDLREVAPDAEMTLVEGNHEARLIKNLSESNPAMMSLLSDFHGISVRELLKLDRYEVNYAASCDLAAYTDAQIRRETSKNTLVLWNSLMVHHFPQGRSEGLPGTNGHHHQHICWTEYSRDRGSYEWHQLGASCKRQAAYCNGLKWNCGFMLANVDVRSREVMFDYIPVGTSFCVVGGQMYVREPDEFYPGLST